MNPQRRISPILFLILMVTLASVAAAGEPGPIQGPGPYNLTLFHTNDTHSAFLPRPASWRDDGRMVGGVIPLAWHLADQRRSVAADLLLDAGDFMTGNPVCTLQEDGIAGVAIARMMNGLGYDAGLIGNHEFDAGGDNLKRLAAKFDFPLLAADILDEARRPVFRAEPLVIERGGLRIGIVGVSCAAMDEVVMPSRLDGLVFVDQAEVVRAQLADLDPVTDLLVLLSHNGIDTDRVLAAQLAAAGLDVIVGGHSHTRLRAPELVDGVLIVQAGGHLTSLGRLDLQVGDDRVVAYDGRLISLWSDGTFAADGFTELVRGYELQMQREFGRRLGELTGDLHRGRGEHDLGNWLSDVLRARAVADVCFINSGGIRTNLDRGPLTAMDIVQVLPFVNTLVTVNLTGGQLASVVQFNADAQVDGSHGILQVSGLRYAFRSAAESGALVETIQVGGTLLDPAATYLVAMPDFVAMMADVYLGIELPEVTDLGAVLSDIVTTEVEQAGTIDVPPAGRITRLDDS